MSKWIQYYDIIIINNESRIVYTLHLHILFLAFSLEQIPKTSMPIAWVPLNLPLDCVSTSPTALTKQHGQLSRISLDFLLWPMLSITDKQIRYVSYSNNNNKIWRYVLPLQFYQCLFQGFAQEGANTWCQIWGGGANTNPRGQPHIGDWVKVPLGPPEINPVLLQFPMYMDYF